MLENNKMYHQASNVRQRLSPFSIFPPRPHSRFACEPTANNQRFSRWIQKSRYSVMTVSFGYQNSFPRSLRPLKMKRLVALVLESECAASQSLTCPSKTSGQTCGTC